MVTSQSATTIVNIITFTIAYFVINTLAGSFRAWSAHKAGDDTAKDMGLLTLNPIAHVDIIGLIALFLFKFGWGKHVPINPFNIVGHWRWLKFIGAYFSDVAIRVFIAFISITTLTIVFGFQTAQICVQMLACETFSPLFLTASCPTLSSFSVTIAYIMMAFAYLSVVFAVLYFINNLLNVIFFITVVQEKDPYLVDEKYRNNQQWVLIATLVIIIFFSYAIRMRLLYYLLYTAAFIAHIFGRLQ